MIYRKIILPLIKPALATIAILSVWNNADVSTYINTDSKHLPFYMSTLSASGNQVVGVGMSAAR